MGAGLGDPALVQHNDEVGVAHRRQAMRDHDGGAVGLQQVEGAANGLLVDRVEMRGRLVEDQDRRILEEGARDRDALALAAAEAGAALADRRVEAIRQGGDELAQRGMLIAACSSASVASGRAIRMLARSVSLKR